MPSLHRQHPLRQWLTLALLCCALALWAQAAQAAERRVALVIGNASYPQRALTNPLNDATDLAAALRRLGFEVMERKNRNADELRRDLVDFQDKLSAGAVGLFYFAGHGVQAGRGQNYLLPVGVDYKRERDAEVYGLEVGTVLRRMEEAGTSLNLVILDACRDSPLPSEGRSMGSRGLGRMEAPSGSLIAFATAPGSTADENIGARNGLYTQHLLRALETPGLRLEDMFSRVRRNVEKDSHRRQSPEEIMKLTSDEPFFFVPAQQGRPTTLAMANPRNDAVASLAPTVPMLMVVPFAGDATAAAWATRAIGRNFERSNGVVIAAGDLPQADENTRPDLKALAARGVGYVMGGSVKPLADGRFDVRYRLWRSADGQDLGGQSRIVQAADLRLAANRASDDVYLRITGQPGKFAQRVAKVMRLGGDQLLMVTDADGANAQQALRSKKLIALPVWSDAHTHLIYLSGESGQAEFYVQELKTGERRKVTDRSALLASCQQEINLLERQPDSMAEDLQSDAWVDNNRSACPQALLAVLAGR